MKRYSILHPFGLSFFSTNSASERVYDVSTVKEFSLTKDPMARWVNLVGTFLPVVIIPFVLVGSYAYRLVQALIYAAIGLMFNSVLKAGLNYPALIRLSFIAVMPVVILDTIRDLAGVAIPFCAFICLLIALAYLFSESGRAAFPKRLTQKFFPGCLSDSV